MSIFSSFVLRASFPARRRVGKEKRLHATMCIERPFNREILYFLTLHDAAFRRFPHRQNGRAEIEILLRKPRKSGLMTGRESKPPSGSPRTDNDRKQWRVRVRVLGVQWHCRTHGALLSSSVGGKKKKKTKGGAVGRRSRAAHYAAYNYYNYRRPPAICSLIATLHSTDSSTHLLVRRATIVRIFAVAERRRETREARCR